MTRSLFIDCGFRSRYRLWSEPFRRLSDPTAGCSDRITTLGNRLEKLSGDLKDFYSIRINKQWRIIFNRNNDNANEVIITDYH